MKRIYIAGPYSDDNVIDILHNIRAGIELSTEVFKAGFAPFCPWLDFMYVLMDRRRKLTIDDFYEYSTAWLKVSDAVLVLDGYENSKGTLNEIEIAKSAGIPVFYNIYKLINHETQF